MKSTLIILILFSSTLLTGQEQQLFSEVDIYCTIVGKQGPNRKKPNISVDFGNSGEGASDIILSKEEERIAQTDFDSMTAALNQLSKSGWTLTETYGIMRSNNKNIHYWILKKKIEITSM